MQFFLLVDDPDANAGRLVEVLHTNGIRVDGIASMNQMSERLKSCATCQYFRRDPSENAGWCVFDITKDKYNPFLKVSVNHVCKEYSSGTPDKD